METDKSKIKKILVISLSNIGDIILTFPVLDILRQDFPDSKISVVIGPKGEPLLKGNPSFEKVYIYHKRQPVTKILAWLWQLRKERFDLIVDLRNTAIPFFTATRYRTSFFLRRDQDKHIRYQHLKRLGSVHDFGKNVPPRCAIFISPPDQVYIEEILRRENNGSEKLVVVGAGAADQRKRWSREGFAQVCDHLINNCQAKIIFIGDANDREITADIIEKMKNPAVDLSGRASLTQVAQVLTRAKFVLSNDSAIVHLASYFNIPLVVLFGPTNPKRYGPWSSRSFFIKKETAPAGPENGQEDPMALITVPDVIETISKNNLI